MAALDPIACAALFIAAFIAAGLVQATWFAWQGSERFNAPLDGGLTFRGRRLFGDNKGVRGLILFVPAAAAALPLAAVLFERTLPSSSALWPLSPIGYAALGAWSALGFMLAELPNSFIKRQLDIAPGAAIGGPASRWQVAADRLDSALGLLVAASVVVPVPWLTWAVILAVGPLVHWCFSIALYQLGLKPRHA